MEILLPFVSILFASTSEEYSTGSSTIGLLVGLVFIVIFLYLYFIPSRIAFKNEKENRFVILIINIFFGGTGLGWLVALALSLSGNKVETKRKTKSR